MEDIKRLKFLEMKTKISEFKKYTGWDKWQIKYCRRKDQ